MPNKSQKRSRRGGNKTRKSTPMPKLTPTKGLGFYLPDKLIESPLMPMPKLVKKSMSKLTPTKGLGFHLPEKMLESPLLPMPKLIKKSMPKLTPTKGLGFHLPEGLLDSAPSTPKKSRK
jgi:hypothetical protein